MRSMLDKVYISISLIVLLGLNAMHLYDNMTFEGVKDPNEEVQVKNPDYITVQKYLYIGLIILILIAMVVMFMSRNQV